MFGRLLDSRETLSRMNAFEREMDHLFDLQGGPRGPRVSVNLQDEGEALVFRADLPGLADGDVGLSLEGDVLSITAERKQQPVEGYRPVRTERAGFRFARSFELPCRVDGEATTASMKNGVLTVTLPKAKEARPRRIPIGPVS